jgi:signal transduction histidine kinase
MRRADGWTARARATWATVVAAGALALVASLTAGAARPPPPPGPADWLLLGALVAATVLLGLRPVELGPDWKASAASAPALALAVLFPPAWAVPAGAAAMVATQALGRRPWPVALFNTAQRTLAVAGASAAAAAAGAHLPAFVALPPLVGALAYFLVNSGSVAAMAAARRGTGWPAAWRAAAMADGPAEAGLLTTGALLAVLVREAPGALLFLAPPVWLGRRVLADAARIRHLNARLDAALAAQRRFLADAAHELRTPVASLRAQLALLRQELDTVPPGAAGDRAGHAAGGRTRAGDPAVRALLEQLAQGTARLSALLADLLTLARADEAAPLADEPVDLEELLVAVYREVQPLAGAVRLVVDLDVDSGGGAPVVRGDPERLRQLLLNLAANALRFTPAGGRVTLRCRRAAGGAVLSVEDSGVGIAAADLPRVFDRFYRADAARDRDPDPDAGGQDAGGGAGLGLAIAKWVAEAHGGTIEAASAPGRGSVFTVRLPLAPPGEARRPSAGARPRARAGRGRRPPSPRRSRVLPHPVRVMRRPTSPPARRSPGRWRLGSAPGRPRRRAAPRRSPAPGGQGAGPRPGRRRPARGRPPSPGRL